MKTLFSRLTIVIGCAALTVMTGCMCVTSSGGRLPSVTSFPAVPTDERPSLALHMTSFRRDKQAFFLSDDGMPSNLKQQFNASRMFSSVISTKDRNEQSADYTVLMEWSDTGKGHRFGLLWLLTAFVFPTIEHTDITLSAQIRDNQEGVVFPVTAVRQGWNTTMSWLVLPVGFFTMDVEESLKDTMYRTLALRVHETINERMEAKVVAKAKADAEARAVAKAKAEAEAQAAEQRRVAEIEAKAKAQAEAKIRAEALEKARKEAEEQRRAQEAEDATPAGQAKLAAIVKDKGINDAIRIEVLKRITDSAVLTEIADSTDSGNTVRIAACDKAINLNPKDATAYFSRGQVYKNSDNHDKALQDFEKAIELDVKYADTFSMIAKDNANSDIMRIAAIKKVADPTVCLEIANRNGNNDTVRIAACDRSIELNPKDATAYFSRGQVYKNSDNHDKALQNFEKAIELDAKYADTFSMIAKDNANSDIMRIAAINKVVDPTVCTEIANSNGNNDTVRIAACDRAIEINPKDAVPYFKRGQIYRQQGNRDTALQDFEKATTLDEKYANSRDGLREEIKQIEVKAKAERKRKEEEAEVERQRREKEKTADTFYKAGVVYFREGEYTKAAEHFNKAVEFGRRDADIYFCRGKANFESSWNSYASAREDFEKVIELEPGNSEAYIWCAKACVGEAQNYYNGRDWSLSKSGGYDKAIERCNKALELDSRNAMAYGWRGKTYFQQGKHDLARRDLDKAAEIDPKLINSWFREDKDVKLMLEVLRGQ